MNIRDVMTRDVCSCSPYDDLATVASLPRNLDCGSLPVVDNQGHPVAMLSDRDICMAAFAQGVPLSSIKVNSAASQELHCVNTFDTIEAAEAIMRREQIRRLPVVDLQDRLVGVISLSDLALQAMKPLIREGYGLTAIGIAQTLAAICEPKPPPRRPEHRG